MQINPSVQIGRTEASGQQLTVGKGIGAFAGIGKGETVLVEVVEIQPGQVVLKTPDGKLINAEFKGTPTLMPGDTVELMMEGRGSGQVQMRMTAVNGQTVNLEAGEIQVKLMDLGIEPSQANTRAAEFLADRGMLPTAARITTLLNIAEQFPNIPSNVALFMVANKIPVSEQNINLLLQWFSDPQPLADKAQQLVTILSNIAPESVPQQSSFLQAFFESVGNAKTDIPQHFFQSDGMQQLAAGLLGASEGEARMEIAQFLAQTDLSPQQKMEATQVLLIAFRAANGAQAAPAAADGQPVVLPQGTGEQGATAQAVPAAPVTPGDAAPVSQQPQNMQQVPQQALSGERPVIQQNTTGQQQAAPVQGPPAEAPQIIQTQGQATPQTQAAGPQQAVIEQPANQPAAQNPVVAQQAVPTAVQTATQQAVSPQVVTAEIQQIINELTSFVVPMKRDVPADAESLQQALKNQQSLADGVRNGLARIAGESAYLTQKAGDMASQIRMGNQLDSFYYCQIPFTVAQQKNNAELYVFERKQQGEGQGEGERTRTTVLIALETQYMGRVETVLRSEEDQLTLEFRVETDRVQKYLSGTVAELQEALGQQEFEVKEIRVVKMIEPTTPMNAMQMVAEQEFFSLQSVDISV